jgi:3-deoxy-D-manno-octulosonic-acid transferase
MFNRVSAFGMQSETYAEHLRKLGIATDRIRVTGNVKYDGVLLDRDNPKTRDLRSAFGIRDEDLVWVAGSTHEPEERIVLSVFRRLRERFPHLKLILVPRAPERFDEVAKLIEGTDQRYTRRSHGTVDPSARMILIDTLGELGAAWGLATIGFTGGSLNDKRGGQSMIEPAAFGVPVMFGPHTWNFRDAVEGLLEVGGAARVQDETQLEQEAARLLSDPALRQQMGAAARAFVIAQQGATARTIDLLERMAGLHRDAETSERSAGPTSH